jgi:hypothetical protein
VLLVEVCSRCVISRRSSLFRPMHGHVRPTISTGFSANCDALERLKLSSPCARNSCACRTHCTVRGEMPAPGQWLCLSARLVAQQTIRAFVGGALLPDDRTTDILSHLLHGRASHRGKDHRDRAHGLRTGSYPGKRSVPVVEVFLEPEGLAT